ncbi:HDOD domain-containing protein [Rhodothermus profundi]|uniref:HDIG domain-containing protein n=1 Tax=Rhodothermus profundi TaxID=633813 RepID=A0A1M6UC41_9BACT|nr:HDOD domain-containing protein [Rhodothermus profundi]SHK66784.1 HDIG domain-containing protein [Rhodothermus profundi]
MSASIPEYIYESVRSLPPLPAAVERLLAMSREPEVDFRKVSQVIESDPALTARILRAANSAFYGVSRRVQTVRQAIVLLGHEVIINLALGVSVLNLKRNLLKQWPGDPAAFWRHSLSVALLARELARQLKLADSEGAFVAGLLHDIGKLVLLSHHGVVYAQALLAARQSPDPLFLLERELFDVDHAAAGYALCQHWNLPEALAQAVAEHHAEEPPASGTIAELVYDANELIKRLGLGDSGNAFTTLQTGPLPPHRRLTFDRLRELIKQLVKELEHTEAILEGPSHREALPTLPSRSRGLVHLHLRDPQLVDLLRIVLWAMGYDALVVGDTESVSVSAPRLLGLIADESVPATRRFAYEQRGIPVITDLIPPHTVHVDLSALRRRLIQALNHPAAVDASQSPVIAHKQ